MNIHLSIIFSLASMSYAWIGCEHSKRWDMLSQLFNVYNIMMHSISSKLHFCLPLIALCTEDYHICKAKLYLSVPLLNYIFHCN